MTIVDLKIYRFQSSTNILFQVEIGFPVLPVRSVEAKRDKRCKTKNEVNVKLISFSYWWRRGRVELPVQRQPLRICYKLGQLFNLIFRASTDRIPKDQPVNLSSPTTGIRVKAPRHCVTQSHPTGARTGWMCYLKITRQRLKLVLRCLFFATSLTSLMTSSACNSVANRPCRNHASP